MEFVYILINGNDWEDMVIFLSKEDAIQESHRYPNNRVEIFSKNNISPSYIPTYNYYQNGEFIKSK